jgi:hypothetical protein
MHAMVLKQVGRPPVWTELPDRQANQALSDLRAGRFEGAAVPVPGSAP